MWRKLNNQYEINTVEQIHIMWQNFYDFNYTQGIIIVIKKKKVYTSSFLFLLGDDMRTHIQKLSTCVDRLRERNLLVEEVQIVSKALATLPEKFKVVRSLWANVPISERT